MSNKRLSGKRMLTAAAVAAILLAGLAAGCLFRSKPVSFDGSRVANSNAFLLDFDVMNASDSHTLRLEGGDTLSVRYTVNKGKIDVEIQAGEQPPIYRGNAIRTGAFELPISEPGDYTIRVDAKGAAGALDFRVSGGASEQ